MVITSSVGLALVGTSAYKILTGEKSKLKRLLKDVFEITGVETKMTGKTGEEIVMQPRIKSVKKKQYGFDVTLELPKGFPVDKFRPKIPAIEQASASKIKMTYLKGRELLMQMGTVQLQQRMDYSSRLAQPGTPSIPYYTPFGIKYLNFWDETTCHIIVAGATRMGKSVFLRLLFTNIMLAMDGNVRFFYVNNKKEDYYPMQKVPQIPEPAETIDDAKEVLGNVFGEIQRRKDLLRSAKDSVNVRQFRIKHPETDVPPVFVVFDEYGRFAENDDFQEYVQEIAETAGYLDIHLVIATQRPDATTVLKPRIRANILTRVCFQTADESNSKIVIHTEEAAHLDEIRGRAIILDGMPSLGHIPYISEEMTADLLLPYRREDEHVDIERQDDIEISDTLPRFVTGPVGEIELPRGGETRSDRESNHAKTASRRSRSANSKTKR